MPRFFHPLLHCFANARHRDLVAQAEYLKAENRVLRSKLPQRVTVTPKERVRLLKLGSKVGPALKHVISIVSHRTFERWAAEAKKPKESIQAKPKRPPGRPRTPHFTRSIRCHGLSFTDRWRLAERFEWHYTPRHGSWLNVAEMELSVLARQCLDRRIPDEESLSREVTTWQRQRNDTQVTVRWQFTTADARIKLHKLYPLIELQ